MESPFIKPTFKNTPLPLSKFLENGSSPGRHAKRFRPSDITELTQKPYLFICGEQGYGKTRLMRELLESHHSNGKNCIYIDLKKTKNDEFGLIEALEEVNHARARYQYGDLLGKPIKFQNDSNLVIGLDALDEVHPDWISEKIEEIKRLFTDFSNVQIILTCRIHHAIRHQGRLHSLNFVCTEIESFDIFQTADFLLQTCPSLQTWNRESVLEKLNEASIISYYQKESVLSTPRYLKVFAELVENDGFDSVLDLTKSQLFEKLIKKRLQEESNKKKYIQSGYSKAIEDMLQVLETLAFILEIQGVNRLEKDNLVAFVQEFYPSIARESFYIKLLDGTIIKDFDDFIEFDNTEFQEYLAAKAIARFNNPQQLICDLIIDSSLKDIYPSWKNTISYLVELKNEIVPYLVQLGIQMKATSFFSFMAYVSPQQIVNIDNEKSGYTLFERVWKYYIQENIELTTEAQKGLILFYDERTHDPILTEHIQSDITQNQIRFRLNLNWLLEGLFIQKKITGSAQKGIWKNYLLDNLQWLPNNRDAESILISSIDALSQICTIEEGIRVREIFQTNSDRVDTAIIRFYKQIDSNHPETIRLFLQDTSQRNFSEYIPSPLNSISNSQGFCALFSQLNSIIDGLKGPHFAHYALNSIGNSLTSPFFDNLEKNWTAEVEQEVIDFFHQSVKIRFYNEEAFIQKLSSVLISKKKEVIKSILEGLDSHNLPLDFQHRISDLCALFFDLENVENFLSWLELRFPESNIPLWTLRKSKLQDIRQLEKTHFPEAYAEIQFSLEKSQKRAQERDKKWERKTMLQFEKWINCLKQKHEHTLIDYFEHLSIQEKATKQNKSALINIAKKALISYDPAEVHIKKINASFETPASLYLFECAIKLTSQTESDVPFARENIIHFLPFAFKEELFQQAYKSVEPLSQEEISNLFDMLMKRDDDLHKSMMGNILALIQKIDSPASFTLLIQIIENEGVPHYHRKDAFDLFVGKYPSNQKVLAWFKLFDKSESNLKSSAYSLALHINEYFLKRQEKQAVLWRFDEIFNHPYHLDEFIPGMRGVLPEEDLGKPIGYINGEVFKEELISFIKTGISISKKDKKLFRYVKHEVWKPAISALFNSTIPSEKFSQILKDISDFLEQEKDHVSFIRFKELLEGVKQEFLKSRAERLSFNASIKKYKAIKERRYLDILTVSDLFEAVKKVIEIDLLREAKQGVYSYLSDLVSQNETMVQKMLASHFKQLLVEYSNKDSVFHSGILNVVRESEIANGKKVDFLINYGPVGTVMVEVKLSRNSELSSGNLENYRDNWFLQYLDQTQSQYGVFLILRIDPHKSKKDFDAQINRVKEVYKGYENIEVMGIDCLGNVD